MISYKSLENLDAYELSELKRISERLHKRICYDLPDASLSIGVKAVNKGGIRKRYTITMKLMGPSIMAVVSQSDWDLSRAIHKAAENLSNRMGKVVKKDSLKHRLKKFFVG